MIVGGICEEIQNADCSSGCTEPKMLNTSCDFECNVEACNFDNGKCVQGPTECGDGYYQQGNACKACENGCNTCASATTCYSCNDSQNTGSIMLLYEGACYDTCPEGTFKNGIACSKCNSTCKTCIGSANTCLTCIDGLFLYNNSCINSCPAETTVTSGIQCLDCSINCLHCEGTYDTCTSCPPEKVQINNQCKTKCPDGYTIVTGSGNVCQKCSDSCLTCNGSVNDCSSCATNQFLYQNNCVGSCPGGTYPNGTECKACVAGCVTCSGGSVCTACDSSKVSFNGLCLEQCPAGYQPNNGACEEIPPPSECAPGCTDTLLNDDKCDAECNNSACNTDNQRCAFSGDCPINQYVDGDQCKDCLLPCASCTSPSSCTACSYQTQGDNAGKTMFLYKDSCYDVCPSRTMQIGIKCYDCNSNCLSCAGDVNTCTTCEEGKVLSDGQCLNNCPADITVLVDQFCQPCNSSCATCSGTVDTCTTCSPDRYLYNGKCFIKCPDTTTAPPSSNVCESCQGNCLNCSQNSNNCTSCKEGYFLYNNSCLAQCPEKITVQKGSSCAACQDPCIECQTDTTLCTVCKAGTNLYQNSCSADCPTGFEARLGVCESYCADGCNSILLSNPDCDVVCNFKSCNYDNGLCTLTECGAGRFRSGQDCVNCEYPCNNCSSLGYCTSCQVSNDGNNTQLLLYNGQCLVQCPVATYRNGLVCEACPQNCNVCQGTVCLECTAPKVLYNDQCINTCPQSTTVKVDQVCEPCNANCSTCGPNTDTCTSCPQGKVLSAGVCVSECQPGFTTTPSSAGQCLQCEGNCETCSGSTSYCTKCKTGKLLDGGCLDTCPYGYAAISSAPTICTRCSSNCVNCEETIDKCTQCGSNQYLTAGNTCQDLPECPDGLTLTSTSNGVCLKCLDPCNTCEESVTRCTSCKNGLALDNYQCTECNSPCATCEGTKTTCKTCEQGYYLSGTKCLQCDSNCNTCTTNSYTCSSCKDGFFLSEGKCLNCSSNCLTCQDTALKCTSCNEGQFLLNNQCVSCSPQCLTCESEPTRCTSCRSRTYIEDFQCKQCDSTCNECEVHASNCLSCNSGQTLINGVCGFCKEGCTECMTDFQKCSKCPDDKTLINGECGNCNQNCATCEQSYTECSSCNIGKYLQGTQCLACDSNCANCELDATHCTSCSPPLSLINNKCVVCDEPCKTCSNTTSTCTSCFQPLVIIGSTCVRCDSACKVCSGAPEICVECDGDKYLNGNTCSQCSENCLGCETSEDNCTSCPTGSELIGNTCLITCPQGYVRVDSQCVECEANCKTCFGTPSSCTSCEIGFVYDNRCVTSCPTGFFKNPETCEQCSSVCKECVNSANTCSVCFEGDKLNNGTCEPICPYGQYVDGGACVDCHPNCKTCRYDGQHCTSCPNPDEVVNSISKVCEVPCEEGYTRTNQSNGVCVKCADQCKTCYGTIDFCLGCSNMNNYIYEGECLPICPAGTAGVGNKCKLCEAPCLTCKGATSTCTSCNSEQLFLFENLCIDSCPEGFEPIGGDCKECLDPTNCPYVPINNGSGSGDVDSQQSDDDNTKPGPEDINTGIVPFPFAGLTLISFSIVLVSKLAVGGINFLPSIISLLSISCFGSWGTVGANFYLDDGDGVQFGRRLVQLNPLVADMGSIGFTLILFGVAVLIVCNIVFVCCFLIKLRKDKQFHNWRSGNKCCYCFYICMCMIFNLHFIRLIYSNMCNKNCFNASFDRKSLLLSPLSKLTYVTLALTCLPIIVGLCLLLLYLEMDQLLWMLSADSLFLTLIFTLLLICDLKKMETTIIRLKFDKAFPVNELTKLISLEQQKFNNLKLRRVNTYTQGEFREIIKPRQRSLSFPLLQPIILPQLQESKDAKSNESFLIKNESTIILDEEFTTITGQFEAGLQEKKDKSNSRPNVVSFHPLHITDIEEFTEVVAFTEQMDSSEDYIDSQTVQEEQEFDFSRAIQDPDDPELVIVPHKITGERYKIRKGFQGSRIVDNNNQIIEIMPPITETSKYDMSKTVVDEADPIYATLRTHQGDKVKVKRNFNGARIVDLEAKVKYPNSQLIGQTIDIESELILHNAYPDTKDPETIITTHAVTGDDIKVRKTFHNARVVDSNGTIIEEEEPIDRNDYDIKSAIVDKNDVHLATLRKRQGNSKVFVRRDFKGAKIIDIIEKPKKQPVEKPPPVYEEDEVYNKHPMEIIKPKPPRPNIVKQKIPKKPKLRPLDLFDYEELDPERQKLEDLAKIINQVEEEQHELIQAREYNETPYKPNVRQNTTSPSSSLQNYQTRNQWIYSPDFQGFQSNPDSLYNSRLSNYDEEPLFALRYAPDRRKNYQQTYDARKVGNQRADSNFRPGTSNERDRVFPFVGNDIVYDRHKQQENV